MEAGKFGFGKIVSELRHSFNEGITLSTAFRLKQLQNLKRMYEECGKDIITALNKDMRKSEFEGALFEVEQLKVDIAGTIRSIDKWAKRDELPTNLLMATDKAFIQNDPYGVVLILGAWNYPFLMALQPLSGAIAAGNCAVIKPSEISTHSSEKIAELVGRYLDQRCFRVVQGGIPETTELLDQKFDYIFSTSNTQVGRIIMSAASKNLTPVTLELGGKSPVYIDSGVDMNVTTKRIIWGKFVNNGQTCIAPDYILCSQEIEDKFIEESRKVLRQYYGSDIKASPDLTRMINKNHFNRVKKLLDDTKGKIVVGGDTHDDDLWIAPSIVANVDNSDALMQQEIFGPVLPIVRADTPMEAVKYIKSRPKPLALYLFSEKKEVQNYFIENSSSGAVCVNDLLIQSTWEGLPFGGVGESGIGNYHGKYSFDTFSHKKSCVIRTLSAFGEKSTEMRYPPYNKTKLRFFAKAMNWMPHFALNTQCFSYMLFFVLGLFTMFVASKL